MTGDRASPGRPGLLWWVLRAQWAWGLLPLALLTEVSRAALAVASASFIAGAYLDWTEARRDRWLRIAPPLLFAAVAAAAADFFRGSQDPLYSISVLVLGIQSVRFLLPKGVRDGWQLSAISFLEFLASAASTTEVQFAVFAFFYMGLCAGAMWALQVQGEEMEADPAVRTVRTGFAAKLLLLAAAGGVLFSMILFIVTPRVGIGQMLRNLRRTEGITGFSDTISLREVTGVKADRRVAARIEFPGYPADISPSGLYLRGATYSVFDGKTWMRPQRHRMRLPRTGSHYTAAPIPGGTLLREADVTLEAMDNPALFVYGTTHLFEGSLGDVWTEGEGSFSLAMPGHPPLRYRIQFSQEASRASVPDPAAARRYLELPAGWDDLGELSARITAGAGSDAEKAEAALRFFRTGFRYAVTDSASSVRDFLFVSKAGYCEHYATALALILRASGIPSRLTAGYMGGEWSDIGKYLIVRQSDAHAWTEALIDGKWLTLDATPPLGENSPFFARTGKPWIYVDWARQRWDKYVINYSLKMQAEGVAEGQLAFHRTRAGIARAFGPAKALRRHGAQLGAAILALLLAAAILRRVIRIPSLNGLTAAQGGEAPLPRDYAAMDNTGSIAADASRFLALYHRDRFGAFPLPPAELREAGRLAARLGREISR
ncbi:MAG: TGc protein [Actinobacteria bacterium]|nr:TGc protein [Actinomycetota bacterium]